MSTEKPKKPHPLDGTLGDKLVEIYAPKEPPSRPDDFVESPLLILTEEQACQIEADQQEILALLKAGKEVDWKKYIRVKL